MGKLAMEELRRETLGDIANETPSEFSKLSDIFQGKRGIGPMKVEIPYEVLGFYMTPAMKESKLDKVFFFATVILGSVITLFTFIWGII